MSVVDVASAAALGVALGAVTGMPIGVVNVAIIDAATRGEKRFAIGIGLGGAIADALHAAIAFVGVGRIVTEHPSWSKAMAVAAALVIAGYAVLAGRRRPEARRRHEHHGVLTGVLLTLPNPAALGAWVAVAAVLWPTVAMAPALALAAGVGAGSAAWFTLLAHVIARLPPEHRVARWLPRLAVVFLVGVALIGVARAFAA